MIPKHSDVIANADYEALLRQLAKARPRSPPKPGKRHKRNVPQRIEGRGNYMVQNPPKSIPLKYPTEVGVRRELGIKAAKVAQDGLLPVPGLDQRSLLYGKR